MKSSGTKSSFPPLLGAYKAASEMSHSVLDLLNQGVNL